MKERQDLRDVEKELEKDDVLSMFSSTRYALWQRRNIMASSAASEGAVEFFLTRVRCKFTAESAGERISKIGLTFWEVMGKS